MTNLKLLKQFGFVKGKTRCKKCNGILTAKKACWAMGSWWHTLTKDCVEEVEEAPSPGKGFLPTSSLNRLVDW